MSDYIGFSFNGVHSSELGIVRTSDGSRFNENLLPTIQDKTVQVPGGDGTYFFGSYYTQRQFNINYAFDSLTEEQLQEIKRLFGDKKTHDLIFDEAPYKVYKAKVTGTASIKHIPFSEGLTNRVYKGEGSLQFTAYDPYARSVKKYLSEYTEFTNEQKKEWKDAANLLETGEGYDVCINKKIRIYNPGVKESDFVLTFNFNGKDNIPASKVYLNADYQLVFDSLIKKGKDDSIKINTKLKLIEGYANGKKTGNIYNSYITDGDFFKIPLTTSADSYLYIDDANFILEHFGKIEYDYLYF